MWPKYTAENVVILLSAIANIMFGLERAKVHDMYFTGVFFITLGVLVLVPYTLKIYSSIKSLRKEEE